MSSTYTARAATKNHVKLNVKVLCFPPRGMRFTHSEAQALHLGTICVLSGMFNGFGNGGGGMKDLAWSSTDALNTSMFSAIKATNFATTLPPRTSSW